MFSVLIALIVVTCALVGASILMLLSRRDASLKFDRENGEAIKIGLIVVAGLYTAGIYYVEMRDQRIANALSYQENATTPYMQRAFKRLDMLWIRGAGYASLKQYRELEDKIKKKAEEGGYAADDVANESIKKRELSNANRELAIKAAELVRNERLEDEIFRICDHYYDIVTCANRGRCHWKTSCELFATDIEKLRLDYWEFIFEWDRLWHEKITKGLKNFFFECRQGERQRSRYSNARQRGRLGVQDTQRHYSG